jgi:hypothetical protein
VHVLDSGNVGIGTSSPSSPLDINAADGVADNAFALRVQNLESTDDRSYGVYIQAGSTSVDSALAIYDHTGANSLLWLAGNGNVGIGTTSPDVFSRGYTRTVGISSNGSTSLAIQSAGDPNYPAIEMGRGSSRQFLIANQAAYSTIGTLENTPLSFITNNSEAMRIDSGNVLVGTSSQIGSEKFGILTTGTGVFAHWKSTGTSGNPQVFRISTGQLSGGIGSGRFITCDDGGADKFFVTGAGVVNAASATITTISDQRLKENIRDLDDGLEKVLALKPRKFDWKENKGENIKNARGFIAQELELVFPDMISNWTDEPPEGEEPYKAVNANLIPTLVKAIQEQQAIIAAMEIRLSALEG